ncbi:MAG: divalent-cation tolerance protein CutA [Rubripirellula sp.]
MSDPTGLILVISTVESAEDAASLARTLVDRGIAACVQIDGPITSHYRWQGKLHQSAEYRLMIKTTSDRWPDLKLDLDQMHPYDEPEIILLPIAEASTGYRDWVVSQTADSDTASD